MRYEFRADRVVDLSQQLEPGIPRPVGFPDPELTVFRTIASGDVINVDRLTLCTHSGTHLDAPRHFFDSGDTIDQMPAECVLGPAVVADLRHLKGAVPIERGHVEQWERDAGERIRAGDAVLLMTGYSRLWGTGPAAETFVTSGWPYISKSLAGYLLEKKVRLVGVESMDLDLADPYDLASSEFVGHRTFLPNGIGIIENLANLDKIGAARCFLVGAPLKIKGGTASPLRVLALV